MPISRSILGSKRNFLRRFLICTSLLAVAFLRLTHSVGLSLGVLRVECVSAVGEYNNILAVFQVPYFGIADITRLVFYPR